MPTPKKGESKDEFISRCVKYVIDDGTASSVKQAVAICYSLWDKRNVSGAMDKRITKNDYIVCSSNAEVASGEKGDEIVIVAYTGTQMRPMAYSENVVVDLSGAGFSKSVIPIIIDHDTKLRFGHSTEKYILKAGESVKIGSKEYHGPAIVIKAVKSSNMGVAKGVLDDIKNGFPFQASIGASVEDYQYLEEEETKEINGAIFKGPLYWIKNSVIREVSLTVLGADSNTNVSIAAMQRGAKMTFNEWLKSVGINADTLDEAGKNQLKAAYDAYTELILNDVGSGGNTRTGNQSDVKSTDDVLKEEIARIEAINATADEFSDSIKSLEVEIDGKTKKFTLNSFKAHAIKNKWSPEKFELECRRAMYPQMNGPAIHVKPEVNYDEFSVKAVECAILRSSGVPARAKNRSTGKEFGYELMYDEKVIEASYSKKYNVNNSLDNLCRMQIMAVGKHPISFDPKELFAQAHESWFMVKAGSAASTFSLTNILENVMYKAALASFEAAETTWQNICATRSLNDFRPHNLYRLTLNGSFKKVGPDGELKHVTMSDEKFTIQADTYGAMIAIDRRTQIDDDLGLVVQRAREIGSLAALRLEEAVYVTLLSNPGSFYSAGNNNLISGSTSALSIGALEIARKKFRDQVINGKPINVTPSILLVGTSLENIAVKLWSQDRYEIAGTSSSVTREFVNNQFVGLYRPVISPYLNNTSITDQDGKPITGQSDTQWYLFANPGAPQGSALVVGFLNGRTTPFFDEAETSFSVPGGIQMRSYYDFGVAMHVPQMSLKSTGA